ncbi:MAG TPA: hypothetical protein VHD88_00470 [Pyrinomonadaceae bacterium]|nr:hypothetical protein [Pyrinomonadaceae bacterium]
MRSSLLTRGILIISIAAYVCAAASATADAPPLNDVAKLLPNRLGDFEAEGPTKPYAGLVFKTATFQDYSPSSAGQRTYKLTTASAPMNQFVAYVVKTNSESAAYALLTAHVNLWLKLEAGEPASNRLTPPLAIHTNEIGTASAIGNTIAFGEVTFVKGSTYVAIGGPGYETSDIRPMESLAKLIASTIAKGEGEIPVLVKHLPDWEKADARALYAVSLGSLKEVAGIQPIFDALSFDGGTEAVTANYGQSQLVIVEFTTPQFAGDNDRRIVAKIQELKSQGQPVPTAYRRVGNYSVLVFNAPDEKTANQLIDKVKYEQVVQWLGDDPHLYERVQNYLIRTTGGVVAAVVEGSVLSLLVCLGIGGLCGALLFRRRRAQQQAAYSDAGGAVRLNLDELTGTSDQHRSLEPGKHVKPDSADS